MLVRSAGKRDSAQVAYGTARSVATCDPRRSEFARRTVGSLQRNVDAVGPLSELDELGVPLHVDAVLMELGAHDSLVVVLPQREHERKRT